MFRELTRKKQALPMDACIDLLRRELRGVLSVQGDGGYPYGVPMDFWYNEEDGHLYFHSGKTGHKVDAIQNSDKVSFCIYDQGTKREGDWSLDFQSVVIFGRIRAVTDPEKAMDVCRKLSLRYTDDLAYIDKEIRLSGPHTLCLELIPEHITGKRVNES